MVLSLILMKIKHSRFHVETGIQYYAILYQIQVKAVYNGVTFLRQSIKCNTIGYVTLKYYTQDVVN